MRGHFGYDSFEFPPHFGPWGRGFGSFGRGRPPFGLMGWPDHHRLGCRPYGPPGLNHSPDLYGTPPPLWPPCGPPPPAACPPPPPHEGHHRRHDERHGMPNDECHERPECDSPGLSDGQHQSPSFGYHETPEDNGARGPYTTSGQPRAPEDCNESSGHHRQQGCEQGGSSQGCERRGPAQECERLQPGPPGDHHEPTERDHNGLRNNDCDYCGRGYEHHIGRKFGPHNHHHPYGDRRSWSNYFDFGLGPHFRKRHECHRRLGPYDRPGGCPGSDPEKCRSGRCCSKNKETQVSNRNKCGRREGDQCGRKNKERKQTENAVLIQRIVVETAPTKPQSI